MHPSLREFSSSLGYCSVAPRGSSCEATGESEEIISSPGGTSSYDVSLISPCPPLQQWQLDALSSETLCCQEEPHPEQRKQASLRRKCAQVSHLP